MPSSAALAALLVTDNNHSAQIVASRSPQLLKRPQTRFKKRKRMAPRVDQFVAADFECDAPLIGSGWRTQHRGPVQSVLLPQNTPKPRIQTFHSNLKNFLRIPNLELHSSCASFATSPCTEMQSATPASLLTTEAEHANFTAMAFAVVFNVSPAGR